MALGTSAEHELVDEAGDPLVYFPSLVGAGTLVYKGTARTTPQLALFFPDLQDERVESAIGSVHSWFSTNTFPSWPLAHPYRFVAHNGEINTVQGNQNWMRAREAMVQSPHSREGDISRVFLICTPGASDDGTVRRGPRAAVSRRYDPPHAVLMMIPEAWRTDADMTPERKAFYRYYSPSWNRGRPGLGRVHRRHPRGRGARPQRSAPEPLLGD